jgi:uncharacterized protein YdiU (UPF0061 family)
LFYLTVIDAAAERVQGRYAYTRQPNVGFWNIRALAVALSSLIDVTEIRTVLTVRPVNSFSLLVVL